jgi:hypothetical protein
LTAQSRQRQKRASAGHEDRFDVSTREHDRRP